MTFRKRDCNNSGTLRVLPPLPPPRYGRATYRDVLDDVTRFLACPLTALMGEAGGGAAAVCVIVYV
jgi:hypothetical protein